jgi:ankyrin repeat protein
MMNRGGHKVEKRIVLTVVLAVLFAASTYAQTTDFLTLVANGTTQQVQDAIKQGADMKTLGFNNMTPLMAAAMGNPRPGVIKALLKAGADLTTRDTTGMTALMLAAYENPSTDAINALLNAVDNYGHLGANMLYDKNPIGETVLMFAAENNPNPEVITLLLKDGALAKAQDMNGKTTLDYAQDNDNLMGTKAYQELEKASQ